ncbi:MAG: SDR family NAD(P)-dependent oxidoreductase [Rhodobacter sp.]|nr:SDR family NAD(P)-dependent oxidoreductase [Rhodobacter sp.]MCA3459204.1 SDR family NAD(P)-dependent oxidoreductase [Rhodobacter sp.]MCA3461818.1 SDR family NAD(P)-dependent oxidoreductase [Rhodobacter sp.]MCA3465844.1 SDR family NAD(P)-dependent oxidoreductase [Rhodobacter sp.]MCA3467989.1 SDR family NAD(P)-dependent oxidoreductase [Rhodobacter sp.]
MREFRGKRYWLVGASEGLGRALAERLSAAGAEVILSARSADRLAEVAATLAGPSMTLPVDVADTASVRRAADAAGQIDGVVFLAGLYWPMAAQGWNADQVETMCDVNFTGCARVIGAALPAMVARGTGHVVITGSLSGFRGLPGAIGYGASKAGVMALAESMQADLRGSGIVVQVANPGFIRTRLTDKNSFTMPFLMEPAEAADHMFRHMQTDRFKVSFPTVFSWLFRLSQFLPDWAYYRIFAPK